MSKRSSSAGSTSNNGPHTDVGTEIQGRTAVRVAGQQVGQRLERARPHETGFERYRSFRLLTSHIVAPLASTDGRVQGGHGWTDLVITPERGLHVVDAILTGLYEPKASHLSMLEALADGEHLAHAYDAALGERYLWHEFGDLHLIT